MMQHNWYLCLQLRNTIRFVMDLGTRPKRSKNKYFFFFLFTLPITYEYYYFRGYFYNLQHYWGMLITILCIKL